MEPIRNTPPVVTAPTERRNRRDEKVDTASQAALGRPVKRAPISPVKLLNNEGVKKLRYAQASMKDTTRDGTAVTQLAKTMATKGYDRRHPIHVVTMPPGPADSPGDKKVAYDTRRTKAARQAATEDKEFFAYVKMKDHSETAEKDYESLRHLTFENKGIPHFIRSAWIREWDKWHDPDLLKQHGIVPKSWGHLIKLRMAMSIDRSRSNQAKTNAGFKESPFVRKTQEAPKPQGGFSAAKRNIFA